MDATATPSRLKSMSPQFLVADLQRSLEFYTDKLGFEVDFQYEGFYAGVRRDGHSIHLKMGEPSPDERANRRRNEHLDILFSVEGLDRLHHELGEQAVEVTLPPRDMPYGREFYIADPDGYILGFLE